MWFTPYAYFLYKDTGCNINRNVVDQPLKIYYFFHDFPPFET